MDWHLKSKLTLKVKAGSFILMLDALVQSRNVSRFDLSTPENLASVDQNEALFALQSRQPILTTKAKLYI